MADPRVTPLTAHSLTEASLFLTASPCQKCGQGPLRTAEHASGEISDNSGEPVEIDAECVSCKARSTWRFRIASSAPDGIINPAAEPSLILDIAQWIMLSGMIAATASSEPDRQEKRRLLIEAAQCLDEALKFYAEDNDLPPLHAFFHDGSKTRFRQSPEHFSRRRLLDLRAKLPHPPTGS